MGQSSSSSSSSSSPSPLLKLADVEVQLIMHGLETKELIRFARCNHTMMRLADSPFSWMHALPPLQAVSSRLVALISGRLLRHTPLSVFVNSDSTDLQLSGLTLSRFASLHFAPSSIPSSLPSTGYSELLHLHPSLNVRSQTHLSPLIMMKQCDDNALNIARMLNGMSRLTSLRIDTDANDYRVWAALSSAPKLTSLSIYDRGPGESWSVLPFVAECVHLRELSLPFATLYQAYFCATLQSPHLRSLTILSLENVWAGRPAAQYPDREFQEEQSDDYVGAFTALTELHTLNLIRIHHIDWMLSFLIHARSLRQLNIRPKGNLIHETNGIPSPIVLAQLMAVATDLTCTLITENAPKESKYRKKVLRVAASNMNALKSAREMRPYSKRVFLQCVKTT